jgi:hypothetical protein
LLIRKEIEVNKLVTGANGGIEIWLLRVSSFMGR